MARRVSVGSKAQYSTLVSNEDYEAVTKNRWTFKISHPPKGGVYARRHYRVSGRRITLLLSHFILGRAGKERPSPAHSADHKNRNTLDDRRENLRWATRKEQAANKSKKSVLNPVLQALIHEEVPF
jgi:hypothetical protein